MSAQLLFSCPGRTEYRSSALSTWVFFGLLGVQVTVAVCGNWKSLGCMV